MSFSSVVLKVEDTLGVRVGEHQKENRKCIKSIKHVQQYNILVNTVSVALCQDGGDSPAIIHHETLEPEGFLSSTINTITWFFR